MVVASNSFFYVLNLLIILCDICVHVQRLQILLVSDHYQFLREREVQYFGSSDSEIVGIIPAVICYRDPWKAKIFWLYIVMSQADV